MQCSISIIYCHYYYYSLTNKTVIISIAHVMKKQEVSVFRTCSVLAKIICKLLSMCGSYSHFLLLHNMCNGNFILLSFSFEYV